MKRIIDILDVRPSVRIANYVGISHDASWPNRTLNDFELIYVVSGVFSFETSDKGKIFIDDGKLLCIYPGIRHTFKPENAPGKEGTISCIHFEMLRGLSFLKGDYELRPPLPVLTDIDGDDTIHALFRTARDTFEGQGRYSDEILESTARQILLRLAEYYTGGVSRRISSRTKSMMRYMRQRLSSPVDRKELARVFSLTPEYVNALFKKELGISPTAYMNRQRIYRAFRLLRENGLSVKETALELGFCDEFYFSKVFKKITGFPPSRIFAQSKLRMDNASR